MELKTIHIKHMCCQRCVEAVEAVLKLLKLEIKSVQLGVAIFVQSEQVTEAELISALHKRGFEVIKTEDEKLTEEIKIRVIELIHRIPENEFSTTVVRAYLEKKTLKSFRVINKIFVKTTQITIQKYTILQRIEKVKALISEGKLNFSEIAYLTGYKTPQHLSAQFKRYEGISMMDYKTEKRETRKFIDEI